MPTVDLNLPQYGEHDWHIKVDAALGALASATGKSIEGVGLTTIAVVTSLPTTQLPGVLYIVKP